MRRMQGYELHAGAPSRSTLLSPSHATRKVAHYAAPLYHTSLGCVANVATVERRASEVAAAPQP
eukprot:scaffold249020_cov28-Tisochrysis_lutea.AAC.5